MNILLQSFGLEIANVIKAIGDNGFMIVFTAAGIILSYQFFNLLIKKYFNVKPEPKFDLTKHTFFIGMDEYKRKVENLDISNPLKKEMAVKFLNIKITAFRDEFYEFVKQDFSRFYQEQLYAAIVEMFEKSIIKYEEQAKKNCIPDTFIKKFNEWHKSRVDSTLYGIKLFLQNPVTSSNHKKIFNVLNVIQIGFMQTIEDAEYTLNTMNGELEKELKKIAEAKKCL